MSNSVDTMKNFFNVLKLYSQDTTTSSVTILDHAVRTVSHFAGLQDAVNHFVSDMANVKATSGATQSLLQNCGIVLGAPNDFTVDTGAVSGLNAGMGVLKDAQSIVPEPNVNLSQLTLPAEGSTTAHSYTGADGKTFHYTINYPATYLTVVDVATSPPDKNGDPDSTYAEKTTLQAGQTYKNASGNVTATTEQIVPAIQTIMRGVENFWASESFKLAYDSFGLEFNNKILTLAFGINQSSQAETGPIASDVAGLSNLPATNIEMDINAVLYAMIDPDNPNGTTRVTNGSCQNYLDRTIAHELIHATMYATGTLKDDMPEFVREGLAELIHGCDDYDSKSTNTVFALAQDSERLAKALAFKSGTGTYDAYPGGDMFLRYLCKQSQPAQVLIANGTPENFTYAGGEEIISGAGTGSQIITTNGVRITTAVALGDDMFVFSTKGNIIVRDVRDKVINFANDSGYVYGRSYMSSTAGTIDGRTLSGYEFISGANFADNEIFAGNKGSQLWGGDYGTDILHGGAGVDNFVTGTYCGNDTIYNANAEDTICLSATSLEQITGINVNANGVSMSFSDGSSLNVVGNVGAKFTLANGTSYRADQSSGSFINA